MKLYGLILLFIPLFPLAAKAQTERDDPTAVVELGGTASKTIHGDTAAGPTAAVEVTPIENWLELEAGVTALRSHGTIEWDTDLIFKKPWTLSKQTELMIGIGPEWIRTKGTNSASLSGILDFMYWPWGKHKIGWYVEPAYEYSLAAGHERAIGVSGGILIAIWK